MQLFDTWAGELDADDYREFELPATQLLIAELARRRYAGDSFHQSIESPARDLAKPASMS